MDIKPSIEEVLDRIVSELDEIARTQAAHNRSTDAAIRAIDRRLANVEIFTEVDIESVKYQHSDEPNIVAAMTNSYQTLQDGLMKRLAVDAAMQIDKEMLDLVKKEKA